MFARIKKSGKYQYLQIVENRKEGKKVKQRVFSYYWPYGSASDQRSGRNAYPIFCQGFPSGHC